MRVCMRMRRWGKHGDTEAGVPDNPQHQMWQEREPAKMQAETALDEKEFAPTGPSQITARAWAPGSRKGGFSGMRFTPA